MNPSLVPYVCRHLCRTTSGAQQRRRELFFEKLQVRPFSPPAPMKPYLSILSLLGDFVYLECPKTCRQEGFQGGNSFNSQPNN